MSWNRVLAHREPADRAAVADRFAANGVTPECVEEVLADAGDGLYAAARSNDPNWADRWGGRVSAALLAAEVSALTAHLNSRSSAIRGLAVDALLEDVSAVTVADRLGVSRQKVYAIARGALKRAYIDNVPWRRS